MLQEAWKAIIGVIFVLVVLFLPNGLAGLVRDLIDRLWLRNRRAALPVLATAVTDPAQ